MKKRRQACLDCGAWVEGNRPCRRCGKAVLGDVEGGRFHIDYALAVDEGCLTYAAVETDTRRPVCIRVQRPDAPPGAVKEMVRELRFLRENGGHGPFPRFLAVGRLPDSSLAYVVFQLVEGRNLREASHGRSATEMVELWMLCASAVADMHGRGWVHASLDPDRFVIADSGEVFLNDLRSVVKADERGVGGGVPGYRAPEQCCVGEPVCRATDVFALGACLYELLTGALPYPPDPRRGLAKPGLRPKLPSSLNPDLPGLLDVVLMRALARAPERRYADAESLRAELAGAFVDRTEVDGVGIEFLSWAERFRDGLQCAGIAMWRAFRSIARLVAKPLGFLLASFIFLRGPAKKVVAVLALLAVGTVSVSTWLSTGEATCQVLSWPVSDVYVNGEYVGEAPSPETIFVPAGRNRFKFTGRRGDTVDFALWCWPRAHYIVTADVERQAFLVERQSQQTPEE